MTDLRALAGRFVALTDELALIRTEMHKALSNGEAPHATGADASNGALEPKRPFLAAQHAGAGNRAKTRRTPKAHPNAIRAREIEAQIIEAIKAQPGITTTAIARATASKTSSTVQRLARLAGSNQIHRDPQGGYALPV